MIHSFNCLDTEALFNSQVVARFRNIERVARRKLLQLHAATVLASLRVPPGNGVWGATERPKQLGLCHWKSVRD